MRLVNLRQRKCRWKLIIPREKRNFAVKTNRNSDESVSGSVHTNKFAPMQTATI